MDMVMWLVVGLFAGGAIGAIATWWISRARGGVVSVMQLKQENDKFKNEVTEHFVETGRLINQLTDSYKQVFDHLSSGAEKLVDEKSLAERLPPASSQEVKLSQFGASVSTGAGGTASGSGSKSSASNPADRKTGGNPKRPESGDGSTSGGDPLKDKAFKSKTTDADSGPGSNSGPDLNPDSSVDATSSDKNPKAETDSEKTSGNKADAEPGNKPGADSAGTPGKSGSTGNQSADKSRSSD